ncbi:MAG: inosine/xanthosine triphosphatase [Acidobacteriota bacterium]
MMTNLKIALGSTRAAKVDAVRGTINRLAEIDAMWRDAEIIALAVETEAPAMPLSDRELLLGARFRAQAVQQSLANQHQLADFFIGLEGGFHSIEFDGKRQTFLRGWAYVTDGNREGLGVSPSILVPDAMVRMVVEERRELGEVIDTVAGECDVRSRQGTWGVLSRDLFTRSMSFETALIAAFAPFYNARLY